MYDQCAHCSHDEFVYVRFEFGNVVAAVAVACAAAAAVCFGVSVALPTHSFQYVHANARIHAFIEEKFAWKKTTTAKESERLRWMCTRKRESTPNEANKRCVFEQSKRSNNLKLSLILGMHAMEREKYVLNTYTRTAMLYRLYRYTYDMYSMYWTHIVHGVCYTVCACRACMSICCCCCSAADCACACL